MFGIETGQMMITCDVTFDKSKFGFAIDSLSEQADTAMLDLDLLEIINNNLRQINYR